MGKGIVQVKSKGRNLNFGTPLILEGLSNVGGGGTLCVAVECADIERNTDSEGSHMDIYRR